MKSRPRSWPRPRSRWRKRRRRICIRNLKITQTTLSPTPYYHPLIIHKIILLKNFQEAIKVGQVSYWSVLLNCRLQVEGIPWLWSLKSPEIPWNLTEIIHLQEFMDELRNFKENLFYFLKKISSQHWFPHTFELILFSYKNLMSFFLF